MEFIFDREESTNKKKVQSNNWEKKCDAKKNKPVLEHETNMTGKKLISEND